MAVSTATSIPAVLLLSDESDATPSIPSRRCRDDTELVQGFMAGEYEGIPLLIGDGKTARKAVEDFKLCYEEEKEYLRKEGKEIPELEFEFIFDVGAFFSYYMINVTAFAAYAGMNASFLRQYACGLKSPTKTTINKISTFIDRYKKDIDAGHLIDRPVPQYI